MSIITISSVLENFIYIDENGKEKKFSKNEVDKLSRLRIGSEDLFVLDENLNDLLSLFSEDSFLNIYNYFKNSKYDNRKDLILNSFPFSTVKKSNYLNLINDLIREKVKGINKCPKCGSTDTTTIGLQTRAGDEMKSEFVNCNNCGAKTKIV